MKRSFMTRVSDEELIYENYMENYSLHRPLLIEAHIADIHFGVPSIPIETHYKIVSEQFLDKIEKIPLDILAIDGDLYDRKVMTNSPVTMYAMMFGKRCVEICKKKKATMVVIDGTNSHDNDQLVSIFYQYISDPDIDIRIVNRVQFEYIKGAKILCIPEMYNMGADYYNKFLKESGPYDSVFMHGMFKGAVHHSDDTLNTYKAPTFSLSDFDNCRGPIISGHIHIPGCFNKYMYYTGSPLRFAHGQEEEKGFIILLHDLNTQYHYTHFEPIKSFIYKTIYLDDIISKDPDIAIKYINDIKEKENIYNLRIKFNKPLSSEDLNKLSIIKNYFRVNKYINIDHNQKKMVEEMMVENELNSKYKDYQFIFDPKLTEIEKMVMYINMKEKCNFITVDEFKKILEDASDVQNS